MYEENASAIAILRSKYHNMADLSFPIGRFKGPGNFDDENIHSYINTIEEFPMRMTALVSGMTEEQLDTPYRPGGWTVRQVVHHTADSHLHAYLRCKRILTEDNPTILPYNQSAWANLSDSVEGNIQSSLNMLEALHQRWVFLLRGQTDDAFARMYTHPEHSGPQNLFFMLGLYAWHGDHHYNHIYQLAIREGWINYSNT
jgi:DinB superfamily